ELESLVDQRHRTQRPDGLIGRGDEAADVDAGRRRLDQHARIERRVEQRQLAHDALDVHAVADLVEAVGDRVPVGQQLWVAGNAEVQRAPDTQQRAAGVAVAGRRLRRGQVEGELGLELDQRVARRVQAELLEL